MTTPILQRRLLEFVDRTAEMGRFCRMLETAEKSVMFVCGDSGIGKSSLLARMVHECSERQRRKAEVTWTDTRPHDYLAVMRKIRDDLGATAFAPFTDMVNFYTKPDYRLKLEISGGPSKIEVGNDARIQNSQVGDIGGVIIKDLMINVPRSDMAVPEAERMQMLTERFIADLRSELQRQPATIFLDAVEKMSSDTEKWVWNELLGPVRDCLLPNAIVVLCGQIRPEVDREWNDCLDIAELRPLEKEHIVEYLHKRSVTGDAAMLEGLAAMLFAATQGKIIDVAKLVDAYLKMQPPRPAGQ